MRLAITVKTNAGKNDVRRQPDGSLLVCVSVSPVEGKANKRVVELLAEYLGRPKSAIRILHGHSSRRKLVEVD